MLVNKTDTQAVTLAGPIVTRPVTDLLAVLSLDNHLYISDFLNLAYDFLQVAINKMFDKIR